MQLFQANQANKVRSLLDKAEKRKSKLSARVETLNEEVKFLYQEKQDDLTVAILEGGEPKKKLTSDLSKAQEELFAAQEQLISIDDVIKNELEKLKVEVDKERKAFVKDKGEVFRKQFEKMNDIKMNYLEEIINYSKMKSKYESEYWSTFREVENRVGLRNYDPRNDFHISLNQRYQTELHYNPMVYTEELHSALKGEISYLTDKNRNKYKML